MWVKSENPQALRQTADAMESYMRSISGLVEVNEECFFGEAGNLN